MLIIRAQDYDDMSRKAARFIAAQVQLKPNSVLGLATGSTPLGTYRELIRFHRQEELTFRDVQTVNLDEYYGLPPTHDQSYCHYMRENLFDHIDITPGNTHVPDGLTQDPNGYGREYDEMITCMGGIDLQLLGIGSNGHIAFNEPGKVFSAPTRLVDLNKNTIEDNARFFDSEEEVPRQAISMGMKSILGAKRILILASGIGKAEAVRAMVEGAVDPMVPASILQLHPDVILIADEAALSLIE
ncbi:MAG: glucosamine-6-phosphate deaminase [Anaerolineaceae bacterium]|jgi:glucosamine-6-phosphate deaminase|nr:glucosamine-6-phosphate deaminase [Anaerolineaceae bacterium]MDD4043271.1 glucosamine-6-phosphate deaminase [Anaerolineaceae bacterium]MDD4578344.1 glucosamine-6-phosphate deaminase [Anaerolineaceae bacterium]